MDALWNELMEATPSAEMDRLKSNRLRLQVQHLRERSLFYERKWAEAGCSNTDPRLENLTAFPLTTKDELRQSLKEAPPLGLHQAASAKDLIRIHSSSGTTGEPTYMGLTRTDAQVWTESISRTFWSAGLRPSDVYAHGLPIGMYVGGIPLQDAVENVGATFFSSAPAGTSRLVRMMNQLGATYLCTTPSYARRLTEFIEQEEQFSPGDLGVRGMALGAEPGTDTYRDELEDAWNCKVVETAGNSDLIPLYYSECIEQNGMHLLVADYLHLELVDPESHEPVAIEEGAEGEAVYTHLKRQASPLFRFKSNDHVRIVGTGRCKCGRTGVRLQIVGRYDDMLIVGGLNVFPSAIESVIKEHASGVVGSNFRILAPGEGPKIEGRLRIKIETHFNQSNAESRDDDVVRQRVEQLIKDHLGFRPDVQIVPRGSIEPSEFKTRYIEDAG